MESNENNKGLVPYTLPVPIKITPANTFKNRFLTKGGVNLRYTKKIGRQLCKIIESTTESLPAMCERIGIAYSTVLSWRRNNAEFALMYQNALAVQMELLGHDCIDIADEEVEKNDMAAVGRNKLRVDVRLKLMEKLAPKTFGKQADVVINNNPNSGQPMNENQFGQFLKKLEDMKKPQIIPIDDYQRPVTEES